MINYKINEFKLLNNEKYPIFLNDKVFKPNLTTFLLIDSVSKIIKKNQTILDLGCGSGFINNYFFHKNLIKKIYSSDISAEAVHCAKFNASHINAPFDIRQGSNFDPWLNYNFDIIINDISGVSAKLTSITDWFDFAPNNSGVDGLDFTIEILNSFEKYLNFGGLFLFPIISLSNKLKLKNYLKKNDFNYSILSKKEWPLPKDLIVNRVYLDELKNNNLINFDDKFGILIASTEICMITKKNL